MERNSNGEGSEVYNDMKFIKSSFTKQKLFSQRPLIVAEVTSARPLGKWCCSNILQL